MVESKGGGRCSRALAGFRPDLLRRKCRAAPPDPLLSPPMLPQSTFPLHTITHTPKRTHMCAHTNMENKKKTSSTSSTITNNHTYDPKNNQQIVLLTEISLRALFCIACTSHPLHHQQNLKFWPLLANLGYFVIHSYTCFCRYGQRVAYHRKVSLPTI